MDTTIVIGLILLLIVSFLVLTEKGRSYSSNILPVMNITPTITPTSTTPTTLYSIKRTPFKYNKRREYLKRYNPHDHHYEESKYYNNDKSDNDYTDEYRGRFKSNRDYREVEDEVQSAIRGNRRNETYTQWVNRNFDPVIPIRL